MHQSQNGNAASAVVLVKLNDVILVRDQLMRPRHAGTVATRKIGLSQLFHLIINQQPRRNGGAGIVLFSRAFIAWRSSRYSGCSPCANAGAARAIEPPSCVCTLTGRIKWSFVPLAQIERAQAAINLIAAVQRYRLMPARTAPPDRTITTRNTGLAPQCSALFAQWPGSIQVDAEEG